MIIFVSYLHLESEYFNQLHSTLIRIRVRVTWGDWRRGHRFLLNRLLLDLCGRQIRIDLGALNTFNSDSAKKNNFDFKIPPLIGQIYTITHLYSCRAK
jgi:hypothetical protein